MKTFVRWCRFNLVGAMGMALQLGTLAVLNHVLPNHYLLVSLISVEVAVLHNFIWHTHYTWRDRRANFSCPSQLLRFHLSNGLVSIAGNLLLMRLLVRSAHLPVLLSNITAIACCSLVNFALSDSWAFRQSSASLPTWV